MLGTGLNNNTQDNDLRERINGRYTKYYGTRAGSVTKNVDVVDIRVHAGDADSIKKAEETVGFRFLPFGVAGSEPIAIMRAINRNWGKAYEDYDPTSKGDFLKITMERYFTDEAHTSGQLSRCRDVNRGGYGYEFAEFNRILGRAQAEKNPMPGLVGVVCWRYVEGR